MWLYESVFYQIYPIGFCGADRLNEGYESNDILNVLGFLEHFKKLGVNCILFNPLFESDSHGYDTRDYMKVDRRLGTNEDFKKLCKTLKENDIKIVLDAVYNHVGRGFWAFKDVQEHRQNSKYANWFKISFDGNSSYNDGFWYEGWEGHFELVKLNLQNEEVVNYLLDCTKFWINEFGIDGLRLDVAYSLDHGFMRRLRSTCSQLKPDFALIGEVLFGDYNLIVNNDMLHSCTNYECYKGLFSSLNDNNLFEIAHSLNRQYGREPWCIYRDKHLMSFLDNHDVSRIYSILNDKEKINVAYALLFCMPGIPCIYYGSEWAQVGNKSDGDWSLRPKFTAPQETELTRLIAKLAKFKRGSKALNFGTYENVFINNKQLFIKRECDGQSVLLLVNIENAQSSISHHSLNGSFFDEVSGEKIELCGNLVLEKYEFRLLRT